MKLLLVLPANVGTVVHCIDQQIADRLGRPDGYEQAVHGAMLGLRDAANNHRQRLFFPGKRLFSSEPSLSTGHRCSCERAVNSRTVLEVLALSRFPQKNWKQRR